MIITSDEYPRCPDCGSTDFYVDGFLGYKQPYSSKIGEYGRTELYWDEDFPTKAECTVCKRDVTQLFAKLKVAAFYVPEWKVR